MNLALSTDVLVPIGAAVVVVAVLLLAWLIVRRVLRSRAASRALAAVRQAQRRPAAQPARRPSPSASTPLASTASEAGEPNGTAPAEPAGPVLPSRATIEPAATEPLAAIGADARRAFAAEPARMPSPRPAPPEPTVADWTGEAAQPSAGILFPPVPEPAEFAAGAEPVDLDRTFDAPYDPWPAADTPDGAGTPFTEEPPGSPAADDLRPVEDTPMAPDSRPADSSATASPDLPPADPGSPEPETAGAGHGMADALQQALAARALAGRLPQPGGTSPAQPDLRDRLLAVLLDNPQEALGAAAELDGHREQLAQLSDALARQEEQLRGLVGKLSAAGLASDQVARLADLPQAEVERLLEQSRNT